ncbi:MAG: hypothetical protein HY774_19095 [Acidobacteria bacterium]|nr:hypothetical protein [Acidobacteriota bacterium]
MTNQTSLEQWKQLFDVAKQLKEQSPWTWMLDSHLFGVQDPVSSNIAYCCVLGNLGEVLGIAAYLGTTGLETFIQIQQGAIGMDPEELLFIQDCLMMSFDDRDLLDKNELATIKKLGLKFRGRQSWPTFKRYEPGFVPWPVNAQEAQFLLYIIEQTMVVAQQLRENPKYLEPPKKKLWQRLTLTERYLTRVPIQTGDSLSWKDEWLAPPPSPKQSSSLGTINEVQLERISKLPIKRGGTWEIDYFHTHAALRDADKPYFPIIGLVVESQSAMVIAPVICKPDQIGTQLVGELFKIAEEHRVLPQTINVLRPELQEFLSPVGKKLSVNIKTVRRLPGLEMARDFMRQMPGF